jgi:hypothetical protein
MHRAGRTSVSGFTAFVGDEALGPACGTVAEVASKRDTDSAASFAALFVCHCCDCEPWLTNGAKDETEDIGLEIDIAVTYSEKLS